MDRINAIANPTLPKVGERFLGTVVKTAAFGAFVSLLPGRDGLLHISKVGDGKRVDKVEDFLNVGDKVEVEIADIDARGKIYLDKVRPEGAEAPADGGRSASRRRPARPAGDRATAATVPWRATERARGEVEPRAVDRRLTGGAAGEARCPARRATDRRRAGVRARRARHRGHPDARRRRGGRHGCERTVLPGGLRVLTEAMPGDAQSASLGIWVGVGSRDETRPLAGVVALPRAPAVQGHHDAHARWRSPTAIEAVGGEINAFTAKEYTCYYAQGARRGPAAGDRRDVRPGHRRAASPRPTWRPSAA